MKTLFSIVFLLGAVGALFAQSPAPVGTPAQCPSGLLLNPVPDGIQWTIAYGAAPEGQTPGLVPGGAGARPTPKPVASKVIVGQSVGEVRHIVTTYGNGNKTDVWKKTRSRRLSGAPVDNSKMDVWERGGSQYIMSTGWKMPVISDSAPDDIYEGLGWISPKNFQTITNYNGVNCMVFSDRIQPPNLRFAPLSSEDSSPDAKKPAATDPEKLKSRVVAIVELDRRLPVLAQTGDAVTYFKFQPLDPSTVLAPPPDVDAALTARVQQTQAATRHAVHP